MRYLLLALLLTSSALAQRTPTIQFKTVADMLAFPLPATNNRLTALVTGRTADNDGAGGVFYFDSASAVATNLGTSFKPPADAGRWLRQYSGPLDITWFGATTANGASANDTAIQNAINSMTAGQVLAIPTGTFTINTLTFNPPSGCGLQCNGTLSSVNALRALLIGGSGQSYYDIRDLKLSNPNGQAGLTGVEFSSFFHSTISVNHVTGWNYPMRVVGNASGIAYNTFTGGRVWNGGTNLWLAATNGGYCNQNTFVGFSLSWDNSIANLTNHVGLLIEDNVSQLNNNTFISPAIESTGATAFGARAAVVHGLCNFFANPRVEGPRGFQFTTNVIRPNYYYGGYCSAGGDPTDDTGKNEIHTAYQGQYFGSPGDLPQTTFRNGSSDSYSALGIVSANGALTNINLRGSGTIESVEVHTLGTDGDSSGQFLATKAGIYRLQLVPAGANNIGIYFDSADSGGYKSGNVGSNFRIWKNGDMLNFDESAGNAVGAAVTWTNGFQMQNNGVTRFQNAVVYSYATNYGLNAVAYFDATPALRGGATAFTAGNGMSGGGDFTGNRVFTWAPSAWTSSTVTLGDASQPTLAWTFNLSGATDPVLTAANNSLSLNVPLSITGGGGVTAALGNFVTSASYILNNVWTVNSANQRMGSAIYLGWSSASDNSAASDTILNRDSAATIQLGLDAASPIAQTLKAHDATGTDHNGAILTLAGGQSTGTGTGGDLVTKTTPSSATGSSANSYSTRTYSSAKGVTLTESSATLFANVSLAASKYAGMELVCTIDADDGTDFQALTSVVNVSAVNKASTVTATLTQVDGTTAASSGTLTCTYTAVANGNGVDIKANAVSSLTQTTLKCRWIITALNSDGVATVTPQ